MNSSNYFLGILFVISTIALVLAILAFTKKKKGKSFHLNLLHQQLHKDPAREDEFTTSSYMYQRNQLLRENAHMAGAYMPYPSGVLKGKVQEYFVNLTPQETELDKLLLQYTTQYINDAKKQGEFLPALYFPAIKDKMEKDKLFHVLQTMPKGGSLHLHSGSQGDVWWIIKIGIYITETSIGRGNTGATCVVALADNAKKSPGLRAAAMGVNNTPEGTLLFVKDADLSVYKAKGFVPVREAKRCKKDFDNWLYNQLCPPGAKGGTMTSTEVWNLFQNVFAKLAIESYAPFYYQYILNSFEILVADNCYLQEIRVLMGGDGFGSLSDFEGNQWAGVDIPALYHRALLEFQKQYPDFRLNIIAASLRDFNHKLALRDLKIALQARVKWPNLVFGWDLVNQEDPNHTTLYYLPLWIALNKLKKEYRVKEFDLFFHDGESDWITNTNVFDCILLDCKRIGHGFNTIFFPKVEEEIKRKNICMEICPISNQILRYVSDLRIHPANHYYHAGVPMVICADDPGVFGITGLSYDFWEATMAWGLDLRALKRLVYNSIVYSNLNTYQQKRMISKINRDWVQWVEEASTLLRKDLRN